MHPLMPVTLLVLFVTTYAQQSEANCDNYDTGITGEGDTCWYCDGNDYDSECYECSSLWELDCDTCSCVYSEAGWIISVVVWAMIYICIGICIYSCRKGYCCGNNGLQAGSSIQANNAPYRTLPDPKTQFAKCKFCGWLERPGTIRCSKCNTSMSSMSDIASKPQQQQQQQNQGLIANDESVSENSLPSSSNPTDFIKCLSCNRYQFAKSDGRKCFYCQALLPESKKEQVMQDEKQEEGVNIGIGIGINNDTEKKCVSCNEFVPKSFKFCNHCGSKFVEDERQCLSCAGLFDKNCKYCPNCGYKAD